MSVGDEYLRDIVHLRVGEHWNDRLKQMIEQANVFQLFWSWNSINSEFVQQEWRYAMTLGHKHFIRPVYWEEPLPELAERDLPPEELKKLHFQKIYPSVFIAREHEVRLSGTQDLNQDETEVLEDTKRYSEKDTSSKTTASSPISIIRWHKKQRYNWLETKTIVGLFCILMTVSYFIYISNGYRMKRILVPSDQKSNAKKQPEHLEEYARRKSLYATEKIEKLPSLSSPVPKRESVFYVKKNIVPPWVHSGNRAFRGENEKAFYGVASASEIKNPDLLRSAADNRAKNEIARILQIYTAALMKDYKTLITEKGMDATFEEAHVEPAINTIVTETITSVEIIDHWQNPETGEFYSKAKLNLKVFNDNLEKIEGIDAKVKDYIKQNEDRIYEELKIEKNNYEVNEQVDINK